MTCVATMRFEPIETGFWVFTDNAGTLYRPVHTPVALQKEGLRAKITFDTARTTVSVFMRGIAVDIITFERI